MIPYQFAILRYRHSASAGELVNIGLVMWVPSEGRILHSLNDRYSRLTSFFAGFDGKFGYRKMVRRLNRHFSDMSSGEAQLKLFSKSSDGLNDLLERLIHRDDSSFQWSEIMAGISEKPDERLTELFVEFVTKHMSSGKLVDRRDEDDIWQNVDAANCGRRDWISSWKRMFKSRAKTTAINSKAVGLTELAKSWNLFLLIIYICLQ